MDYAKILREPDCASSPVGLGGCRASGSDTFDVCAHDIVVFDNDASGAGPRMILRDGRAFVIWHASLSESDSGRLLQYGTMRVLRDESWDLRALIRRVAARRDALYRDHARNSLLQSMFYCQRVRELCDGGSGADARTFESDTHARIFASCWQKCASLCLADAICAMNKKCAGPSHMLNVLRNLPKTRTNEHLSVVMNTVGMERAAVTLLARMALSTAGFADYANGMRGSDGAHIDPADALAIVAAAGRSGDGVNGAAAHSVPGVYSELVMRKHDFFISESLMADCYFYLAYVNMRHLSAVSGTLSRAPDLGHVLGVAFDAEGDIHASGRRANEVHASCVSLMGGLSGI